MVTVNVNTILQKYGWFVFVSTILTISVTFSLNLCLISSPNFPFDFEVGSKKKRRKYNHYGVLVWSPKVNGFIYYLDSDRFSN
jgi:hypothetical protein